MEEIDLQEIVDNPASSLVFMSLVCQDGSTVGTVFSANKICPSKY
jgi:hypothetical protein